MTDLSDRLVNWGLKYYERWDDVHLKRGPKFGMGPRTPVGAMVANRKSNTKIGIEYRRTSRKGNHSSQDFDDLPVFWEGTSPYGMFFRMVRGSNVSMKKEEQFKNINAREFRSEELSLKNSPELWFYGIMILGRGL